MFGRKRGGREVAAENMAHQSDVSISAHCDITKGQFPQMRQWSERHWWGKYFLSSSSSSSHLCVDGISVLLLRIAVRGIWSKWNVIHFNWNVSQDIFLFLGVKLVVFFSCFFFFLWWGYETYLLPFCLAWKTWWLDANGSESGFGWAPAVIRGCYWGHLGWMAFHLPGSPQS